MPSVAEIQSSVTTQNMHGNAQVYQIQGRITSDPKGKTGFQMAPTDVPWSQNIPNLASI